MREFIILLFISVFHLPVFSQENLVINPSMEDSEGKVIHMWNVEREPGVPLVKGWFTPTSGSADYYNDDESSMYGYRIAKARSGEGRAAIIAAGSAKKQRNCEYIQGKLRRPLVMDQLYCVKFYVALDRTSRFTIDSLGIYFSTKPVAREGFKPLRVRPQIVTPADSFITARDGWVEISGLYLANGGEEYFTIGSFSQKHKVRLKSIGSKPQKRTIFSSVKRFAYFYLDDVSVVPLDSSQLGNCPEKQMKIVSRHPRYLFLVDVSSSMNFEGKLDSVRISLKEVINSLPHDTEVALVSFSGTPKRVLDFVPVAEKQKVFNAVDSLRPGGVTNVARSIDHVYQYIESIENIDDAVIVFFTDGIFNVSPSSIERIKKNYEDRKIQFTTLQFGDQENPDLKNIAEQTSGHYILNANVSLQENIEEELYTEVPVEIFEPVHYGKPEVSLVVVRPLRYWVYILLGLGAIKLYTYF